MHFPSSAIRVDSVDEWESYRPCAGINFLSTEVLRQDFSPVGRRDVCTQTEDIVFRSFEAVLPYVGTAAAQPNPHDGEDNHQFFFFFMENC